MKKLLLCLSVLALTASCGGGDTATTADAAKISSMVAYTVAGQTGLSSINSVKANTLGVDLEAPCAGGGTVKTEFSSSAEDLYQDATACASNASCELEMEMQMEYENCRDTWELCSLDVTVDGSSKVKYKFNPSTYLSGGSVKIELDGNISFTSPGLNSGAKINCELKAEITVDTNATTEAEFVQGISYTGEICGNPFTTIQSLIAGTTSELCAASSTPAATDL